MKKIQKRFGSNIDIAGIKKIFPTSNQPNKMTHHVIITCHMSLSAT